MELLVVIFKDSMKSTGETFFQKNEFQNVNITPDKAKQQEDLLTKLKDHPIIVYVAEHFVDWDFYCIVKEYVDGDNLEDNI
jgi:hypothetical protein